MQKTFSDFKLSNATLSALLRRGFSEPTTIQNAIIPRLMASSWHIVGQAQTGTGKTAAFGIPIVENTAPTNRATSALILLPTRELALQCAVELNSFIGHRRINIVPVYGGVSFENQVAQLSGAHIVVATPGRLLDHLRQETVSLKKLRYLVLDEADEMLSMGFIQDVETILQHVNVEKQILMFSATFPDTLHAIAQRYMKKYEHIKVDTGSIANRDIIQQFVQITVRDRLHALQRIIDLYDEFYGLVFCSTKIEVDRVVFGLLNKGFIADGLHGDVSQANRERALDKFKHRMTKVLVATDVAARGIDVRDVSHVVNYSFPRTHESYIHRIGRTGRAGKKGVAITFVLPSELPKLRAMERGLKVTVEPLVLLDGDNMVDYKIARMRDQLYAIMHQDDNSYRQFAKKILQGSNAEIMVAAMLRHFCKDAFDAHNYPPIKTEQYSEDELVNLFFGRGKEHNMTAEKLVDFITKAMYMESNCIENIKVMQSYSFFSVPRKEANAILGYFNANGSSERSLVKPARYKKSHS